MADYDLKLIVDADTTEARRKLDALAEAHRTPEVREAAARAQASAGVRKDERRAPDPLPPKPAQQPASTGQETFEEARARGALFPGGQAMPKDTMTPEEFGAWRDREAKAYDARGGAPKEAEDFGRKAGDVAGRAIGKAVAGFMAHQVASVAFAALKTPGGDNRAVNMAEQTVGGAIGGATTGAMIGGPWGAAIGGVAGGAFGAMGELLRQSKAAQARDNAIALQDRERNRGVVRGASDGAFARSLDLAGGFRQREEMLRARREQLMFGEGNWSVRNLSRKVRELDPESDAGKAAAAQLQLQKDRVAELNNQLVALGFEKAGAPGRMEPGEVADAWSARGIQVGAQVDVAQVNEKIMSEVADCRALLQKIADMGVDRASTITDVQRAIFE